MDMMKLTAGDNAPEEINIFVEIPQGSSIKYEVDKDSGLLFVDRFLHTAMSYPFNYGFIPQTDAEDGDAVDVILISSMPVTPGSVVRARPIGMLEMEDEGGMDNKILAVPIKKIDPDYVDIENIEDISEHTKNKIRHFFENMKSLEKGKWVKLKNFLDKDAAMEEIRKCMK
ncbi:MAG: inorganic diphosphatase [Candidatus Pacebacteria bacterium]|nr:inorganic diphosphatase [Candidatus Paceibacterota bacterium]